MAASLFTTKIQIRLLRNKGLVIRNEKYAKQMLRTIGYSNLIDNYKVPFLDKSKSYEYFIENTTFEEIVALYEFDRKLCSLTLEYVLKIEAKLKSLISYYISTTYGNTGFLNPENFDETKDRKFIEQFIISLKENIHHIIKKNNTTLNINGLHSENLSLERIFHLLTLGETSKLYLNMKHNDEKKIATMYDYRFDGNELINSLNFLTNIRNMCAHGHCLFSLRINSRLKQTTYHKYFKMKGTCDYFSAMTVLKILLSDCDYNNYQEHLESLLRGLSTELRTIKLESIRKIMGLPKNWKILKKLKYKITI